MARDESIKKVLVIGSGPIVIGQAAAVVAVCGVEPAFGHRVLTLEALDTLAAIAVQLAVDGIGRDIGIHIPNDETVVL